MPASCSRFIARSPACGADARGSSLAERCGSSEVTEKCTLTRFSAASGASRSMSRSTSAFLVISENGCFVSSITSISWRVSLNLRSIGWYASVLMPSAIGCGT
ncbi:hypothetical protein G6F59_017084 [Rhizopus arrhizus]|nr:hypothetical protein G6F59_017084 [Rhizopus arrhizus]